MEHEIVYLVSAVTTMFNINKELAGHVTVAILAQGTHWAVASLQAFFRAESRSPTGATYTPSTYVGAPAQPLGEGGGGRPVPSGTPPASHTAPGGGTISLRANRYPSHLHLPH